MEISKAKNYIDFLSNVQYPAVVFCADGEVLSINKAAVNIIGDNITSISMDPDKFMSSDEFWPTLEKTGTIIWHRLMLRVNKKDKYVVSGFVNKTEYDDRTAYIVLFELRSDVAIGSVSLERIINHIGVVALYLYRPDGVWQTRYVSKNIPGLGYKEGDCPNAEHLAKHCVTLPLFPEMTDEEVAMVIDACNQYKGKDR